MHSDFRIIWPISCNCLYLCFDVKLIDMNGLFQSFHKLKCRNMFNKQTETLNKSFDCVCTFSKPLTATKTFLYLLRLNNRHLFLNILFLINYAFNLVDLSGFGEIQKLWRRHDKNCANTIFLFLNHSFEIIVQYTMLA